MSRSRNRARRQQWRDGKREAKKQPLPRKVKPGDLMEGAPISKPVGAVSVYGQAGKYTKRWCEHWQSPFALEEGLSIFASAWTDKPMWKEEQLVPSIIPDIGFYLDNYWQSGSIMTSPGTRLPFESQSHTHKVLWPWPDRGIPAGGMRQFEAALEWLLSSLKAGSIVETGCFAAHGRTGTLLACLLVKQGLDANDAMRRVRKEHCSSAIESAEQVQFVRRLDSHVNGRVHTPGLNDLTPSDWNRGESAGSPTPSTPATGSTAPQKQTTLFQERVPFVDDRSVESIVDRMTANFCSVCPHSNHWGRECDTCGCRFSSKAQALSAPSEPDQQAKDEQADYELWLRLNANDDPAAEEYARQTNIDFDELRDCAYPPCMDPAICTVDEGGCYKAAIWMNGDDEKGWWQ